MIVVVIMFVEFDAYDMLCNLLFAGRSRGDEFFHPPTEISEFYAMAELTKPPVFFTPVADPGELTSKVMKTIAAI